MIKRDNKFNKEIETMANERKQMARRIKETRKEFSEKMRLEKYYLTLHSATVEAIREIENEAHNREGSCEKDMVTAELAIQVIKDLDFKMMTSLFPPNATEGLNAPHKGDRND